MSGGDTAMDEYVAQGEEQVIPNKTLLNIEFPGAVKNHKKAITMLGGPKWVMKAFKGETVMAKLALRPNAAKSHFTVGDMHRSTGLLVRVRYKRRTKEVETMVKGVIKRAMKFNGMCDFQYLPPPGLATQSIKDFPTLMHFVQKATDGDETTQPLCITPLIFSRSDAPFDYSFRSNPYSRLGVITDPDGTVRHERVLTRGAASTTLMHKAWSDLTVPSDPPPKAIETLRKNALALELMPKIREMFTKRPVWSKTALSLALSPVGKDLSHLLRVVLPPVSFTYSSGPYRNLYIRYGYNVRAKPKEGETHPVCYELIDLRLGRMASRNAVQHSRFTIESLDVAAPFRGVQAPSAARPAWPSPADPIYWNRLPLSWVNLFKLMTIGGPMSANTTKVTPKPRTLFVQYIDIQDPTLLMQIQKHALEEARTNDKDTAWLLPVHTKTLRGQLQEKYQKWLDASDELNVNEPSVINLPPVLKDALPNYQGEDAEGEGAEQHQFYQATTPVPEADGSQLDALTPAPFAGLEMDGLDDDDDWEAEEDLGFD